MRIAASHHFPVLFLIEYSLDIQSLIEPPGRGVWEEGVPGDPYGSFLFNGLRERSVKMIVFATVA
jgi:hypothetical protein